MIVGISADNIFCLKSEIIQKTKVFFRLKPESGAHHGLLLFSRKINTASLFLFLNLSHRKGKFFGSDPASGRAVGHYHLSGSTSGFYVYH